MSYTDRMHAAYSRRDVLKQSGLGVAAMACAGIPLGFATLAAPVEAQTGSGDPAAVLTLLLKLKYLESAFYTAGLSMTYPTDFLPDERVALEQVAKQDAAHVIALKAALGAAAPSSPSPSAYDFTGGSGTGCGPFRGVFGAPVTTAPDSSVVAAAAPDKLEFLKVAMLLEDISVRTCIGGIAALLGTAHVSTLSRMHVVDARHSAGIRLLRNSYMDGSTYQAPDVAPYYYVPPWIMKSEVGGVEFADLSFTDTPVYVGGLTQRDFANGQATTVTNGDGTIDQTTVMSGVYGPSNPTSAIPVPSLGEDNVIQRSSQAGPVALARNYGYAADLAFDEPLSPPAAAMLLSLFGVA